MDVILLIIGVFLIWKGKMKTSKIKELSGKAARVIGVIALIPAVIDFGSLFLGLYQSTSTRDIVALVNWPIMLIVLISILVCSKKIPSNTTVN